MSFAFAEIKLQNLERNVASIRDKISKNVEVLAVVKANAYGHGSIEISKKLVSLNVKNLAVATYEEAMEIKCAGVDADFLILGSITEDEIIKSINESITFTVYDISQLHFINSSTLENISFHLKIDTGMNRLGIDREEISESIRIINNNKALQLKGIYTHFPEANNINSLFTQKQIDDFNKIILNFKAEIKDINFFHIANSSGIFNFTNSNLNMVRPGLALYGISDNKKENLFPLMRLKTSLIKIRRINKGESVSYGRTFISDRDMIIGVIPMGYADGLPRALSNKGKVIYKDKECKILGRVCMDLTIIDLSNIVNPKVGDEIIIFGHNSLAATDIAAAAETIPYEIICGISKRVKRVYK
ncbi:alanine racemase [bacterium]|nr:alanine racemase [bacterium]|tara:strand:+ start:2001 stop:3080 length:1080 start_codon:yes stop_codon:yes gene_type:complete